MNKWLELIVGLILVVGAIYVAWGIPSMTAWGTAALIVLKGGIVWFAIMVGLLLLLLGISDIRE